MSERFVLGVDGGGTASSLAAESLDGRRLFETYGGGTNARSAGPEAVYAALRDLEG